MHVTCSIKETESCINAYVLLIREPKTTCKCVKVNPTTTKSWTWHWITKPILGYCNVWLNRISERSKLTSWTCFRTLWSLSLRILWIPCTDWKLWRLAFRCHSLDRLSFVAYVVSLLALLPCWLNFKCKLVYTSTFTRTTF